MNPRRRGPPLESAVLARRSGRSQGDGRGGHAHPRHLAKDKPPGSLPGETGQYKAEDQVPKLDTQVSFPPFPPFSGGNVLV